MKGFLLTVSVNSYFGPSWQLEISEGDVTILKSADGISTEKVVCELNRRTVSLLEKQLADAGVFAWGHHYLDCCILDGTSWSVVIRSGSRQVESCGTNGYPQNWPDFMRILHEHLGFKNSFTSFL
ncbi:MAG: hypothetical protein KGZ79_14175 [Dethiobacter sp.]|jgi:hypothetical protein|nr:hypothetical protein [Dethiobacter sp.]